METPDIFLSKYYQLPENLQKEVLGFIDSIFLNYKKNSEKEIDIPQEVQDTLTLREIYSVKNPETRLNWSEIKKDIIKKYEKV